MTDENKAENEYIFIPGYALSVMNVLRSAGEEVYIVGGCVRDSLLGRPPNDYDMAVSCPPERTLELLSDFRTAATGLSHGTITAISDNRPIELTTFRVDGSYSDMRRPDSVSFTRSLADDLSRRDLTINAMAYSHESSIVDIFGGRSDLNARLLRAVGEPRKRFCEDALRIMRLFRFSAQLGFGVEERTLSAACDCRDGLSHIALERIRSEFLRLLCSPSPQKPLLLMKELGILPYVSGGYAPSDKTIGLLPSMQDDATARLGLYLCECDRTLASALLSRLRCSRKEKSGALAVASNARRAIRSVRDVRRLRADIGAYAPFALRASVLLGVNDSSVLRMPDDAVFPTSAGELAIGGRELLSLGFRGKEIGETLGYLLDAVIDDPSLNESETLIAMAKWKMEN